MRPAGCQISTDKTAKRDATPAYRRKPTNCKTCRATRRKKTLFPRRNRAGQDGTVVLARGCLPTFTHHKLSELLLELHLQSRCYLSCCCLNYHCITAGSLSFNITWLQPPADSRANCMDCALFALLLLPTALLPCRVRQTAANRHQRYGSKQRGGRPRRWGSVICRSMKNSVCRPLRMQLREARGIGRPVWRIDVTGQFPQT
jgi:hypothetical protein